MNLNQVRTVGQPRRNTAPRTPIPPPRMVDESQLKYKPSQEPWVRLLFAPMDMKFVKGQSVQIYDIVPMYRTPSAAPRPDVQPDDYNSLYRYRRRARVTTTSIVATAPISHRNLLPNKPLQPGMPTTHGPRAYDTGKQHVYYLKNRERVTFGGITFDVEKHTGVTLRSVCSRTQLRPLASTSNLESVYYIVEVYFQVQSWEYTNGEEGCSGSSLASVAVDKAEKIRQWTLEPPRYVDANKVMVDLRVHGARRTEERVE